MGLRESLVTKQVQFKATSCVRHRRIHWREPPTKQPKCSQRDWICPGLFLAGKWQCHTVILGGCSAFPLSSRGVLVYWEGTRPGKRHIWHICFCSGSLHCSSSLCDLSLHLSFYTVVFQVKNVSVLYLLARKCQVFSENDMKVLEIYFESEAKNMYWIIF